MKNTKKISLTLMLTMSVMFACQDSFLVEPDRRTISDTFDAQEVNETSLSFLFSEEDNFKRKFAKVLELALSQNETLRKVIKQKANERIDGDYDILVGLIIDQNVSGKSFVRIMAEEAIKRRLYFSNDHTLSAEIDALRTKVSELNRLQISVPINIDKWNTRKFTPPTAVLTTLRDGENAPFIEAYDDCGRTIWLSARIEPKIPVVVVGNSERGYVLDGEFVRFFQGDPITYESDCPPYPVIPQDTTLARRWQFEAFRFDDLRAVESWSAGAPEINIYVATPCGAEVVAYNSVEPDKDDDIMEKWWYHQLHAVDFLNDNESGTGGFTREMEVVLKFLEIDGGTTVDESATYNFSYYGTKTILIPRDGNGENLGYFFLAKDRIGNQEFEIVPTSTQGGFRMIISGATF